MSDDEDDQSLEARHRQERKDLQKQIMALKKAVPKGDNKKKKVPARRRGHRPRC